MKALTLLTVSFPPAEAKQSLASGFVKFGSPYFFEIFIQKSIWSNLGPKVDGSLDFFR